LILLWLRALIECNFYNWKFKPYGGFNVIVRELHQVENFHVGVQFEVIAVNRTTGQVTLKFSK
jgi:hypothetical protein